MTLEREARIELPVLPLRDVVVYPHMVIPLFVGREKSIRCLETAMAQDKQIILVAQRDADLDEPGIDDIFDVGTVASILQLLKLPDGTVKVLVEGGKRAASNAIPRKKSSLLLPHTTWSPKRWTTGKKRCWFAAQSVSLKAISS